MDELLPWSRQPSEPLEMFKMFEYYRDMSKRSLQTVADLFFKSRTSVFNCSKKWKWSDRIRLYDLYLLDGARYKSVENSRENSGVILDKKISISEACRKYINCHINYLENVDDYFDNPLVLKKMKFIRDTLSTLSSLLFHLDYSDDTQLLKVSELRELTVVKLNRQASLLSLPNSDDAQDSPLSEGSSDNVSYLPPQQ
jgi:hypothetical protein